MVARHIAQIIIGGAQVLGRAFARAIQNEVRASQEAARMRNNNRTSEESSATTAVTGMTLKEALDILNVKSIADQETIQKHFDHLFEVNDISKGGTLYIQSKIIRAKERIDAELYATEGEKVSEKEGH